MKWGYPPYRSLGLGCTSTSEKSLVFAKSTALHPLAHDQGYGYCTMICEWSLLGPFIWRLRPPPAVYQPVHFVIRKKLICMCLVLVHDVHRHEIVITMLQATDACFDKVSTLREKKRFTSGGDSSTLDGRNIISVFAILFCCIPRA